MVKLQPSLVYVLEVNPASPAWESGRIGVGDIIRVDSRPVRGECQALENLDGLARVIVMVLQQQKGACGRENRTENASVCVGGVGVGVRQNVT